MNIDNNISLEKNEKDPQKRKLGYKINPAFFVNLNHIDIDDQTEAVINGKKYYIQK
jgi:hypothetical protein